MAAKASVNPETKCWEWQGALSGSGYARCSMKIGGKWVNRIVHRQVYEALVGKVPAGLDLDHLCRVRHCINPAHLEPVTRAENIRRGRAREAHLAWCAAITHCPAGHEYTPDNTAFWGKDNTTRRSCRICSRGRTQAWRQGRL